MKPNAHNRAEVLAGAIALGEATDEERVEYRRHLAACAACLQSLGGEHELERLHSVVQQAHESEMWEPDVRGPLLDRVNTAPRRIAKYGLGILGVCLVLSLIGHFVVGSSLAQIRPSLADPLVINYEGNKIVLERRSVRDEKPPATAPPKMMITHNIVQLSRPVAASSSTRTAVVRAPKPVRHYHEVAMAAPVSDQASKPSSEQGGIAASNSSVPSWRSAIHPARPAYNSTASAPNLNTTRAESLTIAASYTMRDAEPEGGETAINPQPSAIAYQEGAEGTSAFEVMIDENGNPTKCVITKGSGYLVLDTATCKAAMKVHYHPKMLNGHPVPGIYRDAFTFRSTLPANE
ncbi:MAG: hypothetical protein NVSMB31_03110 [Vulcanimicrobiaceae bacterium]